MAIDPLVYSLTPNIYDGKQRSDDPDGVWEPPGQELDLPVPQSLRVPENGVTEQLIAWDLADAGDAQGFELQWWYQSAWRPAPQHEHNIWIRQWRNTGLSGSTLYGYRIRTYSDALGEREFSEWSAETWRTTEQAPIDPPPEGGTDLDAIFFYDDFNGPVGTNLRTYNSIYDACGRTYIHSDATTPGARDRCIRTSCRANHDGWGEWGFEWAASSQRHPRLMAGGEQWWRIWQKFPTGFRFDTTTGGSGFKLKCMRSFKLTNTASGEGGAVELHINAGNRGRASVAERIPSEDYWKEWPPEFHVIYNKWQCWEIYVRFDEQDYAPASVRAWLDGVPMGSFDMKTIRDSDSFSAHLLWHTYWNNKNPLAETREHWAAHHAVACRGYSLSLGREIDDTPYMDRDSTGFPIIGLAVK